jgi:hypothetical protein
VPLAERKAGHRRGRVGADPGQRAQLTDRGRDLASVPRCNYLGARVQPQRAPRVSQPAPLPDRVARGGRRKGGRSRPPCQPSLVGGQDPGHRSLLEHEFADQDRPGAGSRSPPRQVSRVSGVPAGERRLESGAHDETDPAMRAPSQHLSRNADKLAATRLPGQRPHAHPARLRWRGPRLLHTHRHGGRHGPVPLGRGRCPGWCEATGQVEDDVGAGWHVRCDLLAAQVHRAGCVPWCVGRGGLERVERVHGSVRPEVSDDEPWPTGRVRAGRRSGGPWRRWIALRRRDRPGQRPGQRVSGRRRQESTAEPGRDRDEP